MTSKFIYMKFLGLLTVIIGFSYCLTSFYNFFDTIIGDRIINANANLIIMSIGLIIPLFVFIYGVFFYFYADIYKEKRSILVKISTIVMLVSGFLKLLFSYDKIYVMLLPISNLFDFSHISFAYLSLILVIMYIYGIIKYKY